jgi:hypothetical protein
MAWRASSDGSTAAHSRLPEDRAELSRERQPDRPRRPRFREELEEELRRRGMQPELHVLREHHRRCFSGTDIRVEGLDEPGPLADLWDFLFSLPDDVFWAPASAAKARSGGDRPSTTECLSPGLRRKAKSGAGER